METKDERVKDKFSKKDLKNMKITVSMLQQGKNDNEKLFFKMIETKAPNEMLERMECQIDSFNAILFYYEGLIKILEE